MLIAFGQTTGQGWTQVGELTLALVLSATIGLEREIRGKSAGLRTHTIIGFAAALIMLVSKYGFSDVLGDHVTLDPSRMAAQIVSGVGFIGGGIIFVRRDAVRGLTTAASVWLTTAIGMAAGAGLPVLAVLTTLGFFLIAYGLRPLVRRLPALSEGFLRLELSYLDGQGLLREIIHLCTQGGWKVVDLTTRRTSVEGLDPDQPYDSGQKGKGENSTISLAVNVQITLVGHGDFDRLMGNLDDREGILSVKSLPHDEEYD